MTPTLRMDINPPSLFIKKSTLLVVLLLITGSGFAQIAPSAFKLFFEKVYLHTDRETYAAGDDIWFKAYLVNGQTNELTLTSNNLYVELIDPDAKISQRKLMRLDNGLGNGDFKLGDSIPTGIYRIRAYTTWMRNFGDKFLFEKQIRVFTDLEPRKDRVSTLAATNLPGKTAVQIVPAQVNALPHSGNTLQFFPEGGSLIDGVSAMLGFKCAGPSGKGTAAKGLIQTAEGETLDEFSCDSLGLGVVFVHIQPGKKYLAKGTYGDGSPFSVGLPEALARGFSMYAKMTDSLIRITVSSNSATLAEQAGKPLSMIGRTKGKVVYAMQVNFSQAQFIVSIPRTALPEGISAFTLYDATGKPQCERLVYTDAANPVNLSVSTDHQGYSPREKTTVTIKATDRNGHPVKTDFSVAVTDAGVVPANEQDIVSYLSLSSEIRGEIERPSQYFDENNPNRKRQLDVLLLTQGWRDFVWKRLADTLPKITYPVEQGITISGNVTDPAKHRPLAGNNITLFTPNAKTGKLFSTTTDSLGHYFIDNVGIYGKQNIRVTTTNSKGIKQGAITLDSLFSIPPATGTLAPAFTTAEMPAQSAEIASLIERKKQSRKLSLSDIIGLGEVQLKTSKVVQLLDGQVTPWGKDEVYDIDPKDYDHFDLFHYLSHYSRAVIGDIPFVLDVNTGIMIPLKPSDPIPAGMGIFVSFDRMLYYPGPKGRYCFPRLIINGKELPFTDDPDDLELARSYQQTYFSLPVDKVKKVVIKHMVGAPKLKEGGSSYMDAYGNSMTTGASMEAIADVYIVYLTIAEDAIHPLPSDFARANVEGYYNARTFYAPVYPQAAGKTDLRNTIHWEPNLSTNDKGEASFSFYNAGTKTRIRINAEGVAGKQGAVTGYAYYDVR